MSAGSGSVVDRAAEPGEPEGMRTGVFVGSCSLGLLDYFRIPYAVDPYLGQQGFESVRSSSGGASLSWHRDADGPRVAARVIGPDGDARARVFGRVMSDADLQPDLEERGGDWDRWRTLASDDGEHLASIWRNQDGSFFLPFDPDEVIHSYLSEEYMWIQPGAAIRRLIRPLRHGYYRLRWLMPRGVQIAMRRRYAKLQVRAKFPCWPFETAFHDFLDLMLEILGQVSDEPIPCIAPWPNDHTWALVLTHDVERSSGWAATGPVIELEASRGYRSSWNLVPGRYQIETRDVHALVAEGFEVGVHGLYHDGRDLESLALLRERLPRIREAAERWGASGFRAPAMQRQAEWMPLLQFDYDTSYPDTDPFEPQPGGCCTWLPFFNDDMVELPMTLPQDHTLFVILSETDETMWLEKALFLRERGGMALIDTHPDYLADERLMTAYRRFLDHFQADTDAWKALPKEVSAWWRRRAASHLERDGDGWRVVGPASEEARVELCPSRPRGRLAESLDSAP